MGVVFTIEEVRDLVKTRQTDLVIRLYSIFGSKEFQEATKEALTVEFEDYKDYLRKRSLAPINQVGTLFEGIGVLLHRKLIDIALVDELFSEPIYGIWNQMKLMIEYERKRFNQPRMFEWFEYL